MEGALYRKGDFNIAEPKGGGGLVKLPRGRP
jgi:hypothetical protein